MTDTKLAGDFGERLAERFLLERGFRLVCRNWRCRFGEIDLVIRDSSGLVFVEVKLRRSLRFGLPEESISFYKRQRLSLAVRVYLLKLGYEPNYRADVVFLQHSGGKYLVRHIRNVSLF